MKMRTVMMSLVVLAMCGLCHGSIVWDVEYDGSFLPGAADPAWTAVGSQNPRTSAVDNGILSIINNTTGWEGWAINAGPNWNGETTLTLEIRMRQTGTSRVEIGKSNRQWSLVFKNSLIESRFGGDTLAFDTTEWTVFRITKESGTPEDIVKLYINDNPIAADLEITQAGTFDFNLVRIMKMSGGGVMDVDYIRYTSEGAFAPVPEPATLALLGIGAVVAFKKRK